MPSFDVVSAVDLQEVRNAVDQVQREIGQRYDFKGTESTIEIKEALITLLSDSKLEAMQDVLRQKLAKRGVDLNSVKFEEPKKASGDCLRQEVKVKEHLAEDEVKKITKAIKAEKFKVSASIQGNEVRVSGKSKDELQNVMSFLKEKFADLALQFVNFRD